MSKKVAMRRSHLRLAEKPEPVSAPAPQLEQKDWFVEKDGLRFAGTHLLIDLWGASRLDDVPYIEQVLAESVRAAGATLLRIDLHHFQPNGGVSGVAILAESHMSIHTWPERGFASIDLFTCGATRPHEAVAVLRRAFTPSNVQLVEHRRGVTL
ncbi:MAG: adenosylmethionine decarboxylase [Alphaproteobacteria bacterium]|nr:adenosylmethionine decarboxylase [Alphaproteobacteria bacterium]